MAFCRSVAMFGLDFAAFLFLELFSMLVAVLIRLTAPNGEVGIQTRLNQHRHCCTTVATGCNSVVWIEGRIEIPAAFRTCKT